MLRNGEKESKLEGLLNLGMGSTIPKEGGKGVCYSDVKQKKKKGTGGTSAKMEISLHKRGIGKRTVRAWSKEKKKSKGVRFTEKNSNDCNDLRGT